ncbi:MAG: preprotein translocase subunit SecA [Saccharospirillaceae bacterium]|nr:preprotein translocase subunit SecA [Pseudomonadales bacterium]NRB78203.1 preprotein translocase subunit SecA [Saccharospirillaceae bacterium]
MLSTIIKKIVGSKNDRVIKGLMNTVNQINALETDMQALNDEQLRAKTTEFKSRFAEGETIEQLLVEAFAVCRETSVRVMGMRHFDVQLLGGIVLQSGKIPEMRTGEGKTLVATLAVYLNALSGESVHVVTVNDYLAARDANWMRPLYEALGMSVGIVVSQQDPKTKKEAYQADITYGTNNEFGFDYLRDNMAFSLDDKFQRGFGFAVIDEVDSILIDEARTPLIISGAAEDSSLRYKQINLIIPFLERGELDEIEKTTTGDFVVDEKNRSIELTEEGHEKVEQLLIKNKLLPEGESLYSSSNLGLLHHIQSAVKAHHVFKSNVDYIIQENEVVIVDEHTGRTMPGRRWSEGIHQAIEAKEGLVIQRENQTLASTTFQNYFRLYKKLSGMTGTADTEAFELKQIYGLDVVVIPTNTVVQRTDFNDQIFLSVEDKYAAIVKDIIDTTKMKRPVLVGTSSVESSELVSNALTKAKIKHSVLNAKQHENEAYIIAQAGKAGSVTIATNMAGRGTDIVLGGNWKAEVENLKDPTEAQIKKIKDQWQIDHDAVITAGGLHIVGTERHESRRVDNQLRGRSGRQGDPGSSRFYISLDDNLMRIFMSDGIKNFMRKIGEKGEAIEAKMVNNAIEKSQKKVENRNFDIRKSLLEYDDVSNDQRTVVYEQRDELLEIADISDLIETVRENVINTRIEEFVPAQSLREQWELTGLQTALTREFGIDEDIKTWLEDSNFTEEKLRKKALEVATANYKAKEEVAGAENIRKFEKHVMLQVLDQQWKDHLYAMDHLRQSIQLRGYAQKNPKQEFKREAFELFQQMLVSVKADTIRLLSNIKVQSQEEAIEVERQKREALKEKMNFKHEQAGETKAQKAEQKAQPAMAQKRPGRNEPCPCGSGKKYKQCHGKLA